MNAQVEEARSLIRSSLSDLERLTLVCAESGSYWEWHEERSYGDLLRYDAYHQLKLALGG